MNKIIKKNKNYTKTMLLQMIIGFLMLFWYSTTDSVMEKLLVGFVFFTSIIPSTLQLLTMLLNNMVHKGINPNRKVDSKGRIIIQSEKSIDVKIDSKESGMKKQYKCKTVDNEFYLELREMIIYLSRSKKLKRKDVLNLKVRIQQLIGDDLVKYDDFDFKNDMHCIYVLLKNSKLKDEDYLKILYWLKTIS